MSNETFAQRARAGERLTGGLLRMPAETLVEVAGVAGFDFVVIDCEHGPGDVLPLQQHIAAAEARGLGVLVRVGEGESTLVQRALDSGADGVVVPHVDDAAAAAAVVSAACYPPVGNRGFATYSRAGGYGSRSIPEHLEASARTTLVVPMVETPQACAAAAEIFAVPGVDSVLAGPADLSVAMGLTGGGAEPAVRELLAGVVAAAEAAGKPMTTIVPDREQAEAAPRGLIVYNLAHVLLHALRGLVFRD